MSRWYRAYVGTVPDDKLSEVALIAATSKCVAVAVWMSRILTRRSYPDIGSRFGNRDHTTVLHGVNKIARMLLKGDDELRQDIDAIKKVLGVCR